MKGLLIVSLTIFAVAVSAMPADSDVHSSQMEMYAGESSNSRVRRQNPMEQLEGIIRGMQQGPETIKSMIPGDAAPGIEPVSVGQMPIPKLGFGGAR